MVTSDRPGLEVSKGEGQWRLVLPLDPIPCPRPRFARGVAYYPARYTSWRDAVREHLSDVPLPEPNDDTWTVLLHLWCKRPAKPANHYPKGDVDNYAKSVLDAIQGVAFFHDDKQVTRLHVTKDYHKHGHMVIEFIPNEE
jgi:Holliday junction resolvase RusA-like endonuclease